MADNDETSSEDSDSPPIDPDSFKDDDEEEEEAGMPGYQSEKKPGEKVRVAKSTRGVEPEEPEEEPVEESDEDETDGEDEQEGRQFQVTVRGEGTTDVSVDGEEEEGEDEAVDEAAEAQAEQAAESDSDDEEAGEDAEPGRIVERPEERDDPGVSGGEPQGEVGDPGLVVDETAEEADEVSTEAFEQMFEQDGGGVPRQEQYATGDRVEGEVLAVGQNDIFVELDPQTEGIAKRREFESEEGELELEEGDVDEFYVTEVTDDEVYLGQQLEGDQGSTDAIEEAYESGVPVEGDVVGTNSGGFDVEVHGVRVFCPISEIDIGFTEDKEIHVGNTYRFRVNDFEEGGDNIVVSRAAIQREEREKQKQETLEKLEEGMVVEGKVTRTTDFGAFVELGGVEGLIHESELSHHHFDQPSDVVQEGETVEVEVQEIELPDEGKEGSPRISLSRKAVGKDPWAEVNEEFAVGETVEGTVVRNAPFGAFVEISPGVEGLVHVSEMSWTEHVKTPDEVVEPGDKVSVEIQDINIAEKRIGLSMKEAEGDPWDDAVERYSRGMRVSGTVQNIEDFGVFVALGDGITALLPRSEMSLPEGATPFRKFSEGEQVEATILDIDPREREMALTLDEDEEGAEASGDQDDGGEEETSARSHQDDSGGFGTLGDMIGDQLEEE